MGSYMIPHATVCVPVILKSVSMAWCHVGMHRIGWTEYNYIFYLNFTIYVLASFVRFTRHPFLVLFLFSFMIVLSFYLMALNQRIFE